MTWWEPREASMTSTKRSAAWHSPRSSRAGSECISNRRPRHDTHERIRVARVERDIRIGGVGIRQAQVQSLDRQARRLDRQNPRWPDRRTSGAGFRLLPTGDDDHRSRWVVLPEQPRRELLMRARRDSRWLSVYVVQSQISALARQLGGQGVWQDAPSGVKALPTDL